MVRVLFGFALAIVLILSNLPGSGAVAQEMSGVKCVVDGDRNANRQFKSKHADGEVYFCCKGCAATFSKHKKDFHTRANHQLMVTGQYRQIACPIAGGDFDQEQTSKIGGIEVAFCCEKCMAQIDGAGDLAAKAELVFGADAFERAFAKVPSVRDAGETIDWGTVMCVVQTKSAVKKNFVADYRAGKVYFCSRRCLNQFQAEPTKYATQAHVQLVATKQFLQTKCPVNNRKVDGSKTVIVAGQPIAFCCDGCMSKIESATEAERVALVFDDAVFERSFTKAIAANDRLHAMAPEALPDPSNPATKAGK